MSILAWLIFGLMAGAFSYLIYPERDLNGFLQILILSVLGAILGGFFANLVFGDSMSGFSFSSLLIAILGSLTLIALPKVFNREI